MLPVVAVVGIIAEKVACMSDGWLVEEVHKRAALGEQEADTHWLEVEVEV